MLAYVALAIVSGTFLSSIQAHPTAEARGLPEVCVQIKNAVSAASDVFYFGEISYAKDVSHWASSSSQVAQCSVEPGTAQDVGIVLQILGETRTPFGVKGGGHASNPGFSSTTGVQIAMSRFSEVTYDASSQTAVVGSGLVWDDVYEALAPHNVNVVGGRVTGVGVAGFTLGGGYSWLSNQYGLTVDTIAAYELVKPDGSVVTVTESSDADLFFALKGGMNNYGIVTRFTLKTFPQGQVWGGLITFTAEHVDEVTAATAKFAKVTDPKASIITTYNFLVGSIGVSLLIFYDAPTQPAEIFDDFLAIPHFTSDIKTRDFLSLVLASPSDATAGQRAIFNTVPLVELTPTILAAVVNETQFWGSRASLLSGSFISYDVEPFLPSLLSHSSSPSAYPPTRDKVYLPLNIYWAWGLSLSDDVLHDSVRQSTAHLESVAVAEGQSGVDTASTYPNYAIYDTSVSRIYGDNLSRLQAIKAQVDPNNVMGLAGGFKI
ncbi:hypothetical protein V5O48_005864 [Marasmius crinis-equi]|uniref:FAD-binding PCMH-type domain-containing protein n=1 Tax=Marasmius crinis-equi TaxID=585013 RepID=A0ABR3FL62_9AGAR